MADPYASIVALLVVFVAFYVFSRITDLERYGISSTPVYVLFRTERFNAFLGRLAQRARRLWKLTSDIGIVIGVGEMAFAVYFLVNNIWVFAHTPQQASQVAPGLIPGVTISFQWLPYVLIAIGLAATIHEMAHGVVAFNEDIPVKSSGLILAPITYGAFVEPEEEAFNASALRSKLRLLAAGSLTNLSAGVLALLVISALFVPAVLILDVSSTGPAYMAGIRSGDRILSVNGHSTPNLQEFTQYMSGVGPNVTVTIETSRGVRSVTTVESPTNSSKGLLGVTVTDYYPMMRGEVNQSFSTNLYLTLSFVFLVMINLAIFNMLPLFPFDGESFVNYFLKAKLKKGYVPARIAVNLFSLSLMALNIGLSLINFGLSPII